MTIYIDTFYDEFGHNDWQIMFSNKRGRTISKKFYLNPIQNGKKKIELKTELKDGKEKEKTLREYEWPSTATKGLLREVREYLLKIHLRYQQPVQIGKIYLENPEQIKEFFGLEKKVAKSLPQTQISTEPSPHSQSPYLCPLGYQEKSEQLCP